VWFRLRGGDVVGRPRRQASEYEDLLRTYRKYKSVWSSQTKAIQNGRDEYVHDCSRMESTLGGVNLMNFEDDVVVFVESKAVMESELPNASRPRRTKRRNDVSMFSSTLAFPSSESFQNKCLSRCSYVDADVMC